MTVAEMIAAKTALLSAALSSANAEITTMGGAGEATSISGLADAIGTIPQGGSNSNVFVYEVPTTTGTIDITHSLGVVPTHAAAICLDMDNPTAGISKLISGITPIGSANGKVIYYTTAGVLDAVNGGFTISGATETSLRFTTVRNFYGGSTYLFIFA